MLPEHGHGRTLRFRAKIAALLYTFPILALLIIGIVTSHHMIIIGAVIALIGNVGYFVATMRDTRHDP